jgi:hypothetical protein
MFMEYGPKDYERLLGLAIKAEVSIQAVRIQIAGSAGVDGIDPLLEKAQQSAIDVQDMAYAVLGIPDTPDA